MLILCCWLMNKCRPYKTNSVPFYNKMINSGVGLADIRTSSFPIHQLYAFDTAMRKKRAPSFTDNALYTNCEILLHCKC